MSQLDRPVRHGRPGLRRGRRGAGGMGGRGQQSQAPITQAPVRGGRGRRQPAGGLAGGTMGGLLGGMGGMKGLGEMFGAMPQQQLTAQFMANGGMMKSKGMAKGGKV